MVLNLYTQPLPKISLLFFSLDFERTISRQQSALHTRIFIYINKLCRYFVMPILLLLNLPAPLKLRASSGALNGLFQEREFTRDRAGFGLKPIEIHPTGERRSVKQDLVRPGIVDTFCERGNLPAA